MNDHDCWYPAEARCGSAGHYAHGCRGPRCTEAARDAQRQRRGPERASAARLLRGVLGMFEWAHDAACKNMDGNVFFPERGVPAETAKAVCRGCPVRLQCLEYALTAKERFGIWGGMSERERRRLRRHVA